MRGCEFPSDDELLFDDEDLEEDAPSHRDGTKKKKHEGATMKIKWNSLRRLIREEIKRSGLLTEVACPVCGTEGAYVGLHDVECANPSCAHYKRSENAPGTTIFKPGDIVRYDGSYDDDGIPEFGMVDEVEGDLLIVTSLDNPGEEREWDAETCDLVPEDAYPGKKPRKKNWP